MTVFICVLKSHTAILSGLKHSFKYRNTAKENVGQKMQGRKKTLLATVNYSISYDFFFFTQMIKLNVKNPTRQNKGQ